MSPSISGRTHRNKCCLFYKCMHTFPSMISFIYDLRVSLQSLLNLAVDRENSAFYITAAIVRVNVKATFSQLPCSLIWATNQGYQQYLALYTPTHVSAGISGNKSLPFVSCHLNLHSESTYEPSYKWSYKPNYRVCKSSYESSFRPVNQAVNRA